MTEVSRVDAHIDGADRRARVVELRRQRLTFDAIGKQLDPPVTRQRAHQLFTEALAAVQAGAVEALRADHLTELAEARAAVLGVMRRRHLAHSNGKVVLDPDSSEPLVDDGPVLDAARTLAVLLAREARLTGADSAVKVSTDVQVNYTVGGGVDPDLLR